MTRAIVLAVFGGLPRSAVRGRRRGRGEPGGEQWAAEWDWQLVSDALKSISAEELRS
jgi:hypothetical protein